MKVFLATDHAGFELKNEIKVFLESELGFEVIDCGAHEYDPVDDFPVFITEAAAAVAADPENNRAVIFGGSGQGEAMLANRFTRVRAIVYYGGAVEIVKLSREHNDANVLSIGARFVSAVEAKKIIELWFKTKPLADEKYQRRIDQIKEITDQMY